jgi:hypothetical protein
MTCIAGVVGDDGRVYIGGDSARVAGWSITPRADAKVFRRGEWVFGFTSSFRMGQLIRYSLKLPEPPKRDLDRFMATAFVDALRACLKAGGFAEVEHNVESGGTFLVGLRGRLYMVDHDFQAGRSARGFDAVGCGRDEARGALYALHKLKALSPRARVRLALEATAEQNGGVCPPFVVIATQPAAEPEGRSA